MNHKFFEIFKTKLVKQMFYYGLFGLLRNALGYACYLWITHLGANPKIAMTAIYLIAIILSFWENRNIIFDHKGSIVGAGARYLIVHLLGYLINLAILIVMVDKLGYSHQWVQIVAIFVVAGFLFLAFKFFTFNKSILQKRVAQNETLS